MQQISLKDWLKWLIFAVICYHGIYEGPIQAHPLRRSILAIHDSRSQVEQIATATDSSKIGDHAVSDAEMSLSQESLAVVLNHLGYIMESLDLRTQSLPDLEATESYALIVIWLREGSSITEPERYVRWVEQQAQAGRKFLVLGYAGFQLDDPRTRTENLAWQQRFYRALGVEYGSAFVDARRAEVVSKQSEMVEFERRLSYPLPRYDLYLPLAPETKSYLIVKDRETPQSESHMVMANSQHAIVAPDYAIFRELSPPYRRQWRINPFKLIAEILPPVHPIPDFTTENGKRLFYTHLDGDGFRNRSEVQLGQFSSQIIQKTILEKYPQVPFGVSVIVADVHPDWQGSEALVKIAREIFRLPNVEAASHTFTHPLKWQGWDRTSTYSEIGTFTLEREIDEGIHWINDHLLPPSKQTKLVYWSGNTRPPEEALARAEALGVGNLNGGDTRLDATHPTIARVAPLGRKVGKYWQIFTSASNENLYTQLWTANFSGFRQVIQTFQATESPRRLTPVNVYYHFYIADKIPALQSLIDVYQWCLAQDYTMIYPSEYVRIVQGFLKTQIEEVAPGQYRVKERGRLNTLRLDRGEVDLKRSRGIQGLSQANQSWYLALDPQEPEPLIVLRGSPTAKSAGPASGTPAP